MICSNKECGIEFEPKTHNQKYHNDECCRVATNRRIMEKYYEKKAIRQGADRGCKKCGFQLSRYNDTLLCASCQKKTDVGKRSSLLDRINEIS
jgi:hypothetical protein